MFPPRVNSGTEKLKHCRVYAFAIRLNLGCSSAEIATAWCRPTAYRRSRLRWANGSRANGGGPGKRRWRDLVRLYESIREQVSADIQLGSRHRLLGETARQRADRLREEPDRRRLRFVPIDWRWSAAHHGHQGARWRRCAIECRANLQLGGQCQRAESSLSTKCRGGWNAPSKMRFSCAEPDKPGFVHHVYECVTCRSTQSFVTAATWAAPRRGAGAVRKLVEIANAAAAVQNGRMIYDTMYGP